jgi:hypothetical protein
MLAPTPFLVLLLALPALAPAADAWRFAAGSAPETAGRPLLLDDHRHRPYDATPYSYHL